YERRLCLLTLLDALECLRRPRWSRDRRGVAEADVLKMPRRDRRKRVGIAVADDRDHARRVEELRSMPGLEIPTGLGAQGALRAERRHAVRMAVERRLRRQTHGKPVHVVCQRGEIGE